MSATSAAAAVAAANATTTTTAVAPVVKGLKGEKGEARVAPRNPHPNQVSFEKKLHEIDNRIAVLKKRWDELRGVTATGQAKEGQSDARSKLVEEVKGLKQQARQLEEEKKRCFREQEEAREALGKKKGELAAAKERLPFKTVKEIDDKIRELEHSLETGQFRLSEEKSIVQEISKMRKARRELLALDGSGNDAQSVRVRLEHIGVQIGEKNAALANLREQIKRISAQLGELDGEREEERGKRQDRRAQMDRCKQDLDAAYADRRALFEENQKAKKAQYEAKLRREARWAEEKRRRELRDKIEELEEQLALFNPETIHEKRMSECASLTAFFEQFTLGGKAQHASSTSTSSSLAAPVGRQVPKLSADQEVVRKEDSEYFKGASAKGNNKKVSTNSAPAVAAFSMNRVPIQVLAGLGDLSLPIPATAADLPALLQAIERRRVELDARKDEGKEGMMEKRQAIEKEIAALRLQMEKKPEQAKEAETEAAKDDEAEH